MLLHAENCKLDTLSNYSALVETAVKTGYIGQAEVETLKKWRVDPAGWGVKNFAPSRSRDPYSENR